MRGRETTKLFGGLKGFLRRFLVMAQGNMEALVHEVERLSGKKFLIETYENE